MRFGSVRAVAATAAAVLLVVAAAVLVLAGGPTPAPAPAPHATRTPAFTPPTRYANPALDRPRCEDAVAAVTRIVAAAGAPDRLTADQARILSEQAQTAASVCDPGPSRRLFTRVLNPFYAAR